MFYVTDYFGTPIIARWFTDATQAEDTALKLGFDDFVVCCADGSRVED